VTPERWRHVQDLFAEAAEMPAAERGEYLNAQCAGDPALRNAVEKLLEYHDRPHAALDAGPVPEGALRLDDSWRAFQPGQVLARRFQIVRFVGEGGMGEVYEAADLELGSRVALKTLRPVLAGDEKLVERFKQEIGLARRITHVNVCRILDLWCDAETWFCSMEFLEGETLAQRLSRQGPMKPGEALPLLRQAAAGLEAAHAAGIVHRDFKPANVMLCGDRTVVMDFGLARVCAPAGFTITATQSGQAIGTPAYMAPEQIEGKKTGPTADVYSLGVTMFEMLTGRNLYATESPLAMAALKVRGAAPEVKDETIPVLWAQVIRRTLARLPADRFPNPMAVVEALERGGHMWYLPRRMLRRGLLALAAMIFLAAAAWWYNRDPFQPKPEAVREYQRGVAALTEGATAKAIENLERAIVIDDRYPLAYARLAQAYMDSDLIDKAQDQTIRLQRLVAGARLPKRDALLLDAVEKVVLRDYRDAAAVFEKVAAATPRRDRASAWFDLAMAQENGDLLEPAAASYRKVIAADPGNGAAHLRLGVVLMTAQENKESLAELDRAGEIFARHGEVEGQIDVLIARGKLSAQAGNRPGEEQRLNQALRLAAASPDPRQRMDVNLALAANYDVTNRNTEAERIIEDEIAQARQSNREDLAARGMLTLANALLSRLDYPATERAARHALDLAESAGRRLTAASARITLASSLVRQGKTAEGFGYLEPALQFLARQNYGERYRSALQTKVDLLIYLNDDREGLPLARELVAAQERAGDPRAIASARGRIGTFMIIAGDYPGAIAMDHKIREGYQAVGQKLQVALSWASESIADVAMGRLDAARKALGEARSLLPALDGKLRLRGENRVRYAEATLAMAEEHYTEAAGLWSGPGMEPEPVLTPLSHAYAENTQAVAATLRAKPDFFSQLALAEVLLLLKDPKASAKLAESLVRKGEHHQIAAYVFRAALLWNRACRESKAPALADANAARDRLFQSLTATWTGDDRALFKRRPDIRTLWNGH
jgi:Tfp pilus assembly protein PilF